MDDFLADSYLELAPDLDRSDLLDTPLSVAMGMFDGVHLGHQSVINSALHEAQVYGGLAGALTFEPHPSRILKPDDPTKMIYPQALKRDCLFGEGLEFILWKSFSMEFAKIEASEFLPLLKAALPQIRSIHVGSNFRFGARREGDVSLLETVGKELDIEIFSCDRVHHNGEAISSSLIRDLLTEGKIDWVNQLLGRYYTSRGKVKPGNNLGQKIGFPTLNFMWHPELYPRFGVYAVECNIGNGKKQNRVGVANYGIRPTLTEDRIPTLEVHLLNPIDSPPKGEVEVKWCSFLRPEIKFDGVNELIAQIKKDKLAAEEFFGKSQQKGR